MPFQSYKQMRFMYKNHPEIAERWTAEMKAKHQSFPKKAGKLRARKKG